MSAQTLQVYVTFVHDYCMQFDSSNQDLCVVYVVATASLCFTSILMALVRVKF